MLLLDQKRNLHSTTVRRKVVTSKWKLCLETRELGSGNNMISNFLMNILIKVYRIRSTKSTLIWTFCILMKLVCVVCKTTTPGPIGEPADAVSQATSSKKNPLLVG